jgi:colanic acid biosynthesis glycosyl transferase WcaI
MRLLIITQYFPPEMGAPQARLYELATRLRDKGHAVTILTAMPNYPTGRVFPGYRRKLRTEELMDGLRVVRTWIWPSKSSRTLPRLLSYLSFVVSSMALGVWGLGRQDVVLFESPPLFLVPSGLLIGRITGGRIVMNVSDIWPDIIVRMGHTTGGPFLKAMFWLERFGYEHSDVVALTNPGAMGQVKQRFPRVATTVISNGVDTKFFRPDLRSRTVRAELGAGSDDLLVGYCGLHGLAQGLEVALGAAERLRDRPDVKFILVGDGPTKSKLVAMAGEKRLENLTFFDRRPKRDVPAILASCDASLVPLVARLPGTMPSKVYEALAAGTPPIVAKGCEGEALVSKFDAGLAFEPMDAEELAGQVRFLADHPQRLRKMRDNGVRLAKRFERDAIADRTEAILRAVGDRSRLPDVSW